MEPLIKAIATCSKAKLSSDALKNILNTSQKYSSSEPTILEDGLERPVLIGNGKRILIMNHLKAGDLQINKSEEKVILFGIDLDTYELKAVAIARKELSTKEKWASVQQEVKIMKKCEGVEGIIQMDLFLQRDQDIYIVTEYCIPGQLGHVLIALVKVNIDLKILLKVALDAAKGLKNLHALGIIHRDIRPQNIFVIDKPGQAPRALIADLGSAAEINNAKEMKKFTGSYAWFSPERAKAIRPGKTEAELLPEWLKASTDKGDIWGLGCIFFLLFRGGILSWQQTSPNMKEGKKRLISANASELKEKAVTEEIEASHLPPSFKPLIIGMLQVDPLKRLSAAEVYEELLETSKK